MDIALQFAGDRMTPMKPLPKYLIISGLLLFIGGPFLGFLLTGLGMIGAFNSLGQSGISDPNALSQHISTTLIAPIVGFIGAIIGACLAIAGAIIQICSKSRAS